MNEKSEAAAKHREKLLDGGVDIMGLTINEFYGQTGCNLNYDLILKVIPVRCSVASC
jgi:hypothetical protein